MSVLIVIVFPSTDPSNPKGKRALIAHAEGRFQIRSLLYLSRINDSTVIRGQWTSPLIFNHQ
jgi:hypothetical protein